MSSMSRNGYVTVEKAVCFVFFLGGAGPQNKVGGGPLTEKLKTLAPSIQPPFYSRYVARYKVRWVKVFWGGV